MATKKGADIGAIEQILKQYFGFSAFRPGQQEVILSVLQGHDTLAVMPTGGGKSLCYQVPALMFPGLTIVVSPLIALMQDQVSALQKNGIQSCVLNSALDWDCYRDNMNAIRRGEIKLLYLAPETLVTERIQTLLAEVKVSCLTIDEAHCISQWGHDFRPDYRSISDLRIQFPDAVFLALTATATPQVQSDIVKNLKLKKPSVFVSSFNRKNIFLEVVPKKTAKDGGGEKQVLEFIRKHPGQSGIVYCFSRKQVDELTLYLQGKKVAALAYHAGLSDTEREENQNRFVQANKAIVMVATIAFGMGIDKSDVRFVIHFDLPKSIEQYYQEIGRSGRDGQAAHALLLFSYGDTRKIRFFFQEKSGKDLQAAEQQLSAMTAYADSRTCRRKTLLAWFGESYSGNLGETHSENSNQDHPADFCCDVCSRPASVQDADVTIPVQKLLSAILRTGERYGAFYVIDVLLGSRQKRILENTHHKLSVWGIGKEYSKDDWVQLVNLLIDAGFLRKSQDYHVLSLTSDARDTLRERGPVFLPFKKEE